MASSDIVVNPVESKADLNAFIALPKRLYAGHKGYIAPLDVERREAFTPGKNPLFEHVEVRFFLARRAGKVVGYVCYGPTPMTAGTFDLYWIASDPLVRGQGVGAALVSAMEGDLRRRRGRLIRIETSAMEAYGPTRGFYAAMQYKEESRFRDFYKPGEDLIVLAKRL